MSWARMHARPWLAAVLACASAVACAVPVEDAPRTLPKAVGELDASTTVQGSLAGQHYVAAQLGQGDDPHRDAGAALLIARVGPDQHLTPLRVMGLMSPSEVAVTFEAGALVIRSATAHHGLYAVAYHFKPAGSGFRLVRLERQSITPDDDGHAAGHGELWEGVSADLVKGTATYWAQAFHLDRPADQRAWETALQSHRQGRAPSHGRRQQVHLHLPRRWTLQSFDLDTFDASFLCHRFDQRLIFHADCAAGRRHRRRS